MMTSPQTPTRAQLVVAVLEQAFALMQDPKKICVGALARDANRNVSNPYTPHSVCFCSLGAIERLSHKVAQQTDFNVEGILNGRAIDHLTRCLPPEYHGDIGAFHDACAFAQREVFLETWRQAVETARKEA